MNIQNKLTENTYNEYIVYRIIYALSWIKYSSRSSLNSTCGQCPKNVSFGFRSANFPIRIHIPTLFVFIASSSLYNIHDKSTDMIEPSKILKLRKLSLNLGHNVSLLYLLRQYLWSLVCDVLRMSFRNQHYSVALWLSLVSMSVK